MNLLALKIKKPGFSIIETLIASAILAVALASISRVILTKIRRFSKSQEQSENISQLQEQVTLLTWPKLPKSKDSNFEKEIREKFEEISEESSLAPIKNKMRWVTVETEGTKLKTLILKENHDDKK